MITAFTRPVPPLWPFLLVLFSFFAVEAASAYEVIKTGPQARRTHSICETLYAPTELIAATDDIPSIWRAPAAITISEVYCETDQTISIDLGVDSGTVADVIGGTGLACSTGATDNTGLTGNMADGDRLDLIIESASGSPTRLHFCWEYTFD